METETFQHYQILRREDGSLWELGRGAMAVTYKALDNNLRCPVALKVVSTLNLDDEHTRARFVREARAAAALRHRHIASVYHLGSDEQSYFYAMEFIDGETVEDLVIRRGPLPPAEALGIAAQVARALGAAAKQGLVHRDIKPANLMVVREDDEESLVVKVIDFGLARRAVLTDPSAQITQSGFVGTPQYASPEQIEERDLDSRSDIYSLGVTLWFMLTGQPTFAGPVARIGSQHLHDEPPWASVAPLPASVRALLARTLKKNPADRPQDPVALRREIEACLAELAVETPAAPVAPLDGPVRARGDNAGRPPVGDPAVASDEPEAVPQGAPPAAGETLGQRFELLELVGEGSAGQVFRASDTRHGDQPAAVKVFRSDPGRDRTEFHRLQNDWRRLRAAPHPRLVEVLALDQARGYRFMASEWINGFTLVELLRHRGRLGLPEALRLLEDASDAAAHGSANGLGRLQLAPHQVLVHFPAAFAGDKARAVRVIIDRPLAQWPPFGLKIDAVAPTREMSQTPTWAGGLTLVPAPRGSGRDAPSGRRGPDGAGSFYDLGVLLYEMLNGTPPDAGRETPPLPMLGEAANGLLRRALSSDPGFRDEREFFDALLAASGLERASLQFKARPGPALSPGHPAGVATVVPSPEKVAGAVALEAPASGRMAPTIRTKLLRPRTVVPAVTAGASRRVSTKLIVAGATGLAVIAVVTVVLLLSKTASRVARAVPVQSVEGTDVPVDAPTPTPPADESSPTPP